jgi:hypothetical protein
MAARTVNFAAVAATIPAQPVASNFVTARPGAADRLSSPTTMMAATFDEKTREIRVFCQDGHTRRCKVDRLPNINVARGLWKKLTKIGGSKPVVFVAAGGFSPDVWFYDVK